MENKPTADLDYKALYHKHLEEIEYLKMKLMDSEDHIQALKNDLARLSGIKATVEVIFGRKFDGEKAD